MKCGEGEGEGEGEGKHGLKLICITRGTPLKPIKWRFGIVVRKRKRFILKVEHEACKSVVWTRLTAPSLTSEIISCHVLVS